MAAAVALAERGVAVTVYEGARRLGGRARSLVLKDSVLDNGQHLLIGAYRDTLRLIDMVGIPSERLWRLPFTWRIDRQFCFHAASLPAPWHLALGLLRSSGLSIAARIDCMRFLANCRRENFALRHDLPVIQLLREHRQTAEIIRLLWAPLCVAALNTPIEAASAQVFLNVLRDTLGAERSASEMILPRCDLSGLFPEPAAEYVRARAGRILLGESVLRIEAASDGFSLTAASGQTRHAAVVIATHPSRVNALVGHMQPMVPIVDQITAMTYEPIVTVYLRYSQSPRLPAPMVGLADACTQWLFDRQAISAQSGLIAAVISARGRHQTFTHQELAQQVHKEIAAAFACVEPPQWTQVIEEKRATFACVPNLARPDQQTPVPGLFLAGDYTRSLYPATLEAAVRSGLRCAVLVNEHLPAQRSH
jgi:squalene-associated FAD-dependent desaturase